MLTHMNTTHKVVKTLLENLYILQKRPLSTMIITYTGINVMKLFIS